jgi:membrane fusion protein, multidrug efflux system
MSSNNSNGQDGSNEIQVARARMRRPRWLPILVIIIVLVVGGPFAYRFWVDMSTSEGTDDATIKADVVSVSSRITGNVIEVDVTDNQRVEAGDVLVKLDTHDLEISLQTAQASYDLALKNAEAAQSGVTLSDSQTGAQTTSAQGGLSLSSTAIEVARAAVETANAAVSSAQSKLDQAQVTYDQTKQDYDRSKKLLDEDVIAQQQLDHMESALKLAQSGVETAKEDLKSARIRLTQAELNIKVAQAQRTQSEGAMQGAASGNKQTDMRQKQYEAALAQVQVAQTTLDNAKLQLSYATITAPTAGRIGKLSVLAGQRVNSGSPLMALVKDGTWIVANFKETQMKRIRVGMPVEVKVDAFPGRAFKAHVDSLSPASGAAFALLPPDNATGNFTKVVQRIPIKIVFDNGAIAGYESLLASGMSVVVRVRVTAPQSGGTA